MMVEKQERSTGDRIDLLGDLEEFRKLEKQRVTLRKQLEVIAKKIGLSPEMLTLLYTVDSISSTALGATAEEIMQAYPSEHIEYFLRVMAEDGYLTAEDRGGKMYYCLTGRSKSLFR